MASCGCAHTKNTIAPNLLYNPMLLRDDHPNAAHPGPQNRYKRLSYIPPTSSKSIDVRTALRSEAHNKVKNGFSIIFEYKTIKDQLPPTLKFYPLVYIPHKSRLYSVILDLSFRLCVNGKYHSLVYYDTVKTAPQQSMGQLGSTLKWLITLMADNYDLEFPLIFTKIDIAEGFWWLVVSHLQVWNLCYVLHEANGWPVSLD